MTLIDKIRTIIPNSSISQDDYWFPTETEKDHQDTLSLMEYVKYNFGYVFILRTWNIGRKMEDDVPEETKARRLQEIVDLNKNMLGFAQNSLDKRRSFSRKVSKNQLRNFQEEIQSITVVFQRREIIKLGIFV
jgi:tRNA-2-methylthio-N6-dimethylallyladenosine synthase